MQDQTTRSATAEVWHRAEPAAATVAAVLIVAAVVLNVPASPVEQLVVMALTLQVLHHLAVRLHRVDRQDSADPADATDPAARRAAAVDVSLAVTSAAGAGLAVSGPGAGLLFAAAVAVGILAWSEGHHMSAD